MLFVKELEIIQMLKFLVKLKNWCQTKDLSACSNCGYYYSEEDPWQKDGCDCYYPKTWTW